eukprot:TRINITY_DN4941_c0_g1_i3.p1 TRINITY_DN4941_c0_g1~~TRINITY_DN4941_c0_g1_i3.p1  ORF type:complete len:306 (-),score=62.01 TRINITY_DN4941_c0_g1_i3:172-1089(-)
MAPALFDLSSPATSLASAALLTAFSMSMEPATAFVASVEPAAAMLSTKTTYCVLHAAVGLAFKEAIWDPSTPVTAASLETVELAASRALAAETSESPSALASDFLPLADSTVSFAGLADRFAEPHVAAAVESSALDARPTYTLRRPERRRPHRARRRPHPWPCRPHSPLTFGRLGRRLFRADGARPLPATLPPPPLEAVLPVSAIVDSTTTVDPWVPAPVADEPTASPPPPLLRPPLFLERQVLVVVVVWVAPLELPVGSPLRLDDDWSADAAVERPVAVEPTLPPVALSVRATTAGSSLGSLLS